MNQKFMIAGLFFVFIVLSGLWLSRMGRPIHVIILTIHKLISLAALVYLFFNVYRIQQAAPLSPLAIAACVGSLLFFIVLFISGGLLSTAKAMPAFVLRIHQIAPLLVILTSGTALYVL